MIRVHVEPLIYQVPNDLSYKFVESCYKIVFKKNKKNNKNNDP